MTEREALTLRILAQLEPAQVMELAAWVECRGTEPILAWKTEKDGLLWTLLAGAYTARVERMPVKEEPRWAWEVCKRDYLRRSAWEANAALAIRQAERALFSFILADLATLEEAMKRQASLTSGLRVVR